MDDRLGWGDPVQAFNERTDERIRGRNMFIRSWKGAGRPDTMVLPPGLCSFAEEGFRAHAALYGCLVASAPAEPSVGS